jgi:succinate dehydrogenase / fumarate reductase cytochrome b subunit
MTSGLRLPQHIPSARRPEPVGDKGRLRRLLNLYQSSVGRKFIMALSGIAIIGFVVAHLIGTLKIFLGAEETNEYGEALRDLGGHLAPHGHLLWIMRIGLVGAFAVHLHAAFSLDRRNRQATGKSRYESQRFSAANYASRTMLWSGIIVGLFIIFHMADLTWGATNDDFVGGDAFNNQIASFSNPAIVAVYLAAILALVSHLRHGLSSLVQSMGSRIAWLSEIIRDRLALGASVAIGLGYASIPLAVQVGILDYANQR